MAVFVRCSGFWSPAFGRTERLMSSLEPGVRPLLLSLLRSFAVDNGNKFFDYKDVEQRLGTKPFFVAPVCPGQRGLNENTNSLFRQYSPKKFDFSAISPRQLQVVVDSLNARPRKRLGFRSPFDCFPRQRLMHFT